MRAGNFWSGFAAGTAVGAFAGIGGALALRRLASEADRRVVRLQKSINVGGPVQKVFAAWSNFEQLPSRIGFIKRVERHGRHWRWLVNLDGRAFRWDAHITQVIPNESIGWKSLRGPRHTGRITFSPAGDQTVVNVIMNYAPPLGTVGAMLAMQERLQHWIERGLRDFKAAVEHELHAAGQRTGTTGEETSWQAET